MLKNKYQVLVGYSVIHAIVDFVSVSMVLSSVLLSQLNLDLSVAMVIAYNLSAFGLQAPLGVLVDKLKAPRESAILACLLLLLSLPFYLNPIFVVFFTGLANALFHVGGGSISLNISNKKALYPGIFVAPGALGLTLGVLQGLSANIPFTLLLTLLLASLLFIIFSKIPKISYIRSKEPQKKINYFYLIIIFLLISVSIRSLYGLSAVFSWKTGNFWLITLTIFIVLGKALGGLIADKLGWQKTAIIALAISAPLLAFFPSYPFLAITGAFLFQMTMPIILTALSNLMPGKSATAFGLSVFALALGTLPVYFTVENVFRDKYIIFSIIVLSLIFLVFSFKQLRPYFRDKLGIRI